MKKHMFGRLIAFLQLIRWYNLLIAMGVFYFTRWYLVDAFLEIEKIKPPFNEWTFLWLVANYLLIMAAGYALNDYYDVGMDEINRPDRIVLRKKLPLETGVRSFIIIISIALVSALVQAFVMREKYLFIFPFFVAALMWFYSTKFKRELFWGNFSVAVLAFLNVFLIFLHYMMLFPTTAEIPTYTYPIIFRLVLFYSLLAGGITFVREVIKDIMDVEGDKAFGCNNFPIRWGIEKTKYIVTVFEVVLLLFLGLLTYVFWNFRYHYVFWYSVLILFPFWVYVMYLTWTAKTKNDFKQVALVVKIYMIAGMLSMQLVPSSWV